jgi:predicted metal-dependent hydrolase
VRDRILPIFQEIYGQLRPGAAVPGISVEFYSYTGISNTIRMRSGKLLVRLSDQLEGAPEAVLGSLAHILLSKLYRLPVERAHSLRYRKYVCTHDVNQKSRLVRQLRGRKQLRSAQGRWYDLEAIFDNLNTKFFYGLLGRPRMSWSQRGARNMLGHYDPAHNAIIISRIFDHFAVPRYAVEYIVYHEMLHLKHPVRLRGSRRCVHSAEFQAEEKLFPHMAQASAFLKRM